MAYTEFNLQDIFAKQFGYTPQDFKIKESHITKKSEVGKYGSYYAKDAMGRDVFMPVTLGGLFLPYTWINISNSKRIIETPLTERRGTVKEFISMEDYKIGLKGLVIGHNGQFPEKDIEDLRTLWERNVALEIKSILTDIFLLTPEHGGQDKVVITDFSLAENQGVEHVRAFTMELKTDQEFELYLK